MVKPVAVDLFLIAMFIFISVPAGNYEAQASLSQTLFFKIKILTM
jgi:hypothetical protein